MMRLLPWTGEGGKPAYLLTGDPNSCLSRLADNLEAVQLGMAEDLLSRTQTLMTDEKPSETELRSVVGFLSEALRDSLRVARSRGERLPESDAGNDAVSFVARADGPVGGGR